MHIRDGILSPEVCAVTAVISVAAVGYSLRQLRADLADKAVLLTGMMAALVFAAQMVNFPLFGLPVSGHLLGGVLASVMLGPWAGCLAIAMVLAVQAVVFSDGGLLSLGANTLNMGVVGAWGGNAVYSASRRVLGASRGSTIFSAASAAWISVVAAAGLFCVEFGLSTQSKAFDPRSILLMMVSYHALIGVGEAIITGSVLAFVLSRRPDLVPQLDAIQPVRESTRFAVAGLVASLAIAAFLAPFKSEHADGLDHVSNKMGFASLEVEQPPLLLEDYAIPTSTDGWWTVSLAGLLGTIVVFSIVLAIGRAVRWKAPQVTLAGGTDE